LRNPSGPCGSELLLSAQAKAVILQCAPGLQYFQLGDQLEIPIPPLREELALIKLYGGTTLALGLNAKHMQSDRLGTIRSDLEDELGVPVIDCLSEGVSRLLHRLARATVKPFSVARRLCSQTACGGC